MRNCMVLIILLFIVLLVSSCQGYEAVSTVKFITQHGFSVERMPDWYLIHAVKQPPWKIHYGFDDNNKCHSSGVVDKDDFEQQLKESIVKAVQLWLQPLREGSNEIVTTFELELKDTVSVVEKSLIDMRAEQKIAIEEDDLPHFRITFNCMESEGKFPEGTEEYPRSFVMLGTVPQVFMFHYRKPAKTCGEGSDTNCVATEERDQSEIFPHDKMSSEHMFMMTTLLHEVGHAFGLKDVYVETDEDVQKRRESFNRSTGGSERTVGKQPNSIMGVASIIGLREKEEEGEEEFVITTDDEEAIKWLYLQAHEGVALNICPTDYEMEKDTEGCVPRFPLIFAVREGDITIVQRLLEDDSIDINSCDRHGNTALFYAQQGKYGHGDTMEQLLLSKDADTTVECAAVDQTKAEPPDTVVAEADATEVVATEAGATTKAFNLKEKLRCSTLAHHDVSRHKLLLLLLMLPAMLSFPLVSVSLKLPMTRSKPSIFRS